MKMTDTQRSIIARTGLGLSIGGPLTYALIRFYEAYGKPPPNPLLIITDTHIAYFWRVIIALWIACVVAIAFSMLNQPSPKTLGMTICMTSITLMIIAFYFP